MRRRAEVPRCRSRIFSLRTPSSRSVTIGATASTRLGSRNSIMRGRARSLELREAPVNSPLRGTTEVVFGGSTKRPPEGGLSAALIEAENQCCANAPARRSCDPTPRINLRAAGSCCGVKRFVPDEKPAGRCTDDTTEHSIQGDFVFEGGASGEYSPLSPGVLTELGARCWRWSAAPNIRNGPPRNIGRPVSWLASPQSRTEEVTRNHEPRAQGGVYRFNVQSLFR